MNASVHSALKMSPAQIIFGNAITLDKGVIMPHRQQKEGEPQIPMTEWAENMRRKQALILQLAKAAQQQTDEYHIIQASPLRTEFPINSHVLVQYAYHDRPPTKFHSNWKGPMRVLRFNKSEYLLEDLVTHKQETYHIKYLKAFNYDQLRINPLDIARAESDEFVVERILDHRKPNNKSRKDYEFKVQWRGYDGSHNSWEPWANMRDNEVLNEYLYDNKMKNLLTGVQKVEVRAWKAARVAGGP